MDHDPRPPQPPDPPGLRISGGPRCPKCRSFDLEVGNARGRRCGQISCQSCGWSRDYFKWQAARERRAWIVGVSIILFMGAVIALGIVESKAKDSPYRGRGLDVPERGE